jgi:hypothetical protein
MPRRKMIPVDREDIPTFANESEEHEFWKTHSFSAKILEEMSQDFDPDLPSPEEVRAHIDERRGRETTERTQPVPIRFEVDLLRRLRAVAARKQIGYQTLLKTFVAERLYEEEKREGIIGSRSDKTLAQFARAANTQLARAPRAPRPRVEAPTPPRSRSRGVASPRSERN